MAKKKYKNMKLEQEELKPISIGAFESRKRTSLGIFVILILFILVVIFLPQISEVINEYLEPTPSTSVTPENPTVDETPSEEEPEENVDEEFYDYVAGLNIERENITVSGITIDAEAYTITYEVTNTTNSYQDIEDLNYYIEIYNSERTLLERIKLASPSISGTTAISTILAGGATQSYTRTISEESATTAGYIILVSKTTDDYPDVTLSDSNDGVATLVCSNAHEIVTYSFENNALKQVTSIVEYLVTDLDYETVYSNYQTLSNSYNSSLGITSTFFMNANGFNITTIVDLEEASRSYIFSADTFELNTEPKVVNFEMSAQGFTCN